MFGCLIRVGVEGCEVFVLIMDGVKEIGLTRRLLVTEEDEETAVEEEEEDTVTDPVTDPPFVRVFNIGTDGGITDVVTFEGKDALIGMEVGGVLFALRDTDICCCCCCGGGSPLFIIPLFMVVFVG